MDKIKFNKLLEDANLNKIFALFHGLIVEYAKLNIKGSKVGGSLVRGKS